MKEKKKLKPIHIIVDVLFFGIIGFMVLCFVWNFVDIKSGYKYPLFGHRSTVIVSESMATVNEANDYITSDMKQIQKFDVITTKGYKSFDDIQIYDIATYFNGSKDLVCHRVIDKYESEGKQYVVFRGDANNINDAPVSYELIRGKVDKVTPKVGHVVAFIQSPYMFIALFGTIFFVCLGLFIMSNKKDKKEPQKEVNTPNNNEEPVQPAVEEQMDEKLPEDSINEEKPVEAPQEPSQEEQHAVQPDEKMPEDDVIEEKEAQEEAEPVQEEVKEPEQVPEQVEEPVGQPDEKMPEDDIKKDETPQEENNKEEIPEDKKE